ncbi:MAG: CBS domain-containing protein, partial [Bacteroidota bacterium]
LSESCVRTRRVSFTLPLDDDHYTTEIAKFNLEVNLDPFELHSDCFSKMDRQLRDLLNKAGDVCDGRDTKILLTGILPTITKNELVFDYMTPNPRYWALNEMMKKARGDDFNLNIRGINELVIRHESVLFEACNTSFQMHLQITPNDFIKSYNWAQAIAGPVLGISANSPLLLGRELWAETRIALFQQSIDTRNSSYALKDQQARVTFGDSWAFNSVADFYKNEIARYKIIFAKEIKENSLQVLERGEVPKLEAICTHNGSIYRWNRPCYGIGGGKPHLRIENRYIPAGPTVIDEMANFAFWVGLMIGRPKEYDDIDKKMDFNDAKSNFIKAARTGKESVMTWNGHLISVRDLISNELLPIAQQGLEKVNVDPKDIQKYLSVIENRALGLTGAQWITKNYRLLKKTKKRDEALLALTKSMYQNQFKSKPVHEWSSQDISMDAHESAHLVSHVMSTQLFTVNQNDLAELATSIMEWKDIRHLPVEDDNGNLCGLLTWSQMKKFQEDNELHSSMKVADIMTKVLFTAHPNISIKEAINQMETGKFKYLLIVQDEHLVGIVTLKDLLPLNHD